MQNLYFVHLICSWGGKIDLIAKLSKKERTKILHTQLMTYYRERILDGRLSAGTRLPTDEDLAALYQISRDTVRQALALLANEGLIERVQGRGTFVSQPPSNGSQVTRLKQKQIGLVLNRTYRTQLTMNLLVGVEQAAKSHGYNVSFTYAEGEQDQQARDIARLQRFPVERRTAGQQRADVGGQIPADVPA